MPALGPLVGSPVVAIGAAVVGPPSLSGGAKIPLADSAVIYEYSYSTGTGPYTLTGAYGSWKTFADGYNDGDTVYYRATDKSSSTEYVVGTFSAAAGTLTRDIILGSTNSDNPISWTGRTRVLVHALVQGLPLCTTPPMDGQVLAWDALTNEYCPVSLVTADVDVFIHRVTAGTSDTFLVLPAPQNIIIWSSGDAGAKTQGIPAASGNDSVILHVKMNPAVTDTLTITAASGTIEGQSSVAMEAPDSLMLIGDGPAANWAIL